MYTTLFFTSVKIDYRTEKQKGHNVRKKRFVHADDQIAYIPKDIGK